MPRFTRHAEEQFAQLYSGMTPQQLWAGTSPVPAEIVAGLTRRPVSRCQDNYFATPDARGLLVCTAENVIVTILRMGLDAEAVLRRFLKLDPAEIIAGR